MLIYVNYIDLWISKYSETTSWIWTPKNTCVRDFAEKLEHFIYFRPGIFILCAFLAIIMVIYANLC